MTPLETLLSPAQLEAWRACRAPGTAPVTEFAAASGRAKGTVGNHLARAERKLADAHREFVEAAEPVDFLTERDDRTTSWERAAPMHEDTRISRINRFAWLVELPDGQPHVTALVRRDDWFSGWCDCDGFQYQEGPCAHLCTLRQGAYVHVQSDDGERVEAPDADASREPVTDGGREVVDREHAGADGRVFGRPEGRL
jgi:hypothetical protein